MAKSEQVNEIQEAFIKSREGAILRCAAIMVNLKRKDLAKQILETTRIDRKRFEELKTLNT